MVAGRYRLPWDDTIAVRDGTPCGFAAPTRAYRGAEPNPFETPASSSFRKAA
jgi:formamidase